MLCERSLLFHSSVLTGFSSVSFPPQLDDEDSILPHKLQAALEHVLDKRRELACEKGDLPNGDSAQSTHYSISSVNMCCIYVMNELFYWK